MSKVVRKKRKINIQKVFNLVSFMFILACIIFYGGRFIKQYLENNKEEKIEVLADKIKKENKDNLKNINGEYYFQNKEENNYIEYSNILFRIIKINKDNTITIVSDKPLAALAKGKSTNKVSYINMWLNNQNKENTGILEDNLNNKDKYLTYTNTCNDEINNTKSIPCDSKEKDILITVPSLYDYINTGEKEGFMNNETYFYLNNTNNKKETWYVTDKGNIKTSDNTDIMGIKATLTLKNTNKLISGKGTKENPYKFEEEQSLLGSYVKLNNEIWRVYKIENNTLKLSLDTYLKEGSEEVTNKYSDNGYYHNDAKQGTLAYYLNHTYLAKQNYNNIIEETNFSNGVYSYENEYDYTKVLSKTVPTKLSLLSIGDIIINPDNTNYYLSTGLNNNSKQVYVMTNDFKLYTKDSLANLKIIPTISINKDNLTGDGTKDKPMEVKE